MSQSASYAPGSNLIWLLNSDGTPIDFGAPHLPRTELIPVVPDATTADKTSDEHEPPCWTADANTPSATPQTP